MVVLFPAPGNRCFEKLRQVICAKCRILNRGNTGTKNAAAASKIAASMVAPRKEVWATGAKPTMAQNHPFVPFVKITKRYRMREKGPYGICADGV